MDDEDEEGIAPGLFPYLPITARRCDPMNESADCKQVCRCDDNSDYAIKEAAVIATMPHNEWLCSKLAERVRIAAPTFRIVDVLGIECFGSRWQAGQERNWWNRAFAGQIDFADIAPGISRIIALDLFVHNHDRHLDNYFVLEQRVGFSVLAMDFGRAWMFHGFPLPSLPMPPDANTVGDFRKLVKLFGHFVVDAEVDDVCDRLTKVDHEEIDGFIGSHPPSWLPESDKIAILDWWQSSDRTDRIESVRKGIKDGTFL